MRCWIPLTDTEYVGTKVLVAHGSTRALKQAVQELQLAGCDVIATPDGGDAFARFFEDQPAAVICSANLPSLSGINFARMVRAQAPDTQVVILSKESIYDVPPGAFVLGEPLSIADLRRILPGLFPGTGDGPISADLQAPVFVQAVLRRFERDSDLLTALDDEGIRELAEVAEHRSCVEGDQIIRQGDAGDGFYLVVEGQVRVTLAERDDAQVARIGPGGFFGEMSLLNEQPRSASVWSIGPSTLLFFDKALVLPLLTTYPRVREVLSGVALKRTEDNLWSVLFDESEVDQTLADLEQSLQAPLPPSTEPQQAPTTARVVERGETLPVNDHSEPEPEITYENPEPEAPLIEEPSPEELAEAAEAEAARKRMHEDATREFAALGYDAEPQPHEDTPPEDTSRDVDVSQQMDALPRPPPRSSVPAFAFGTGLGFGIGLAAAVFLVPMLAPSGPSEPVVTQTGTPPIGSVTPEGDTSIEADDDEPDGDPDPDTDSGANLIPGENAEESSGEPNAAADTPNEPGLVPQPGPDEKLAAIPGFTVEERELTPEQDALRKSLRKRMFNAASSQAWNLVIRQGERLRKELRLDWEAQLKLAEAQRKTGAREAAIATYRHFVATYPTNFNAGNARFWLAELYLERGDRERAKRLYGRVVADDRSDFSANAKRRLEEL
ncbi:MAG: cyclic nucleotide-binding domain-containing protein [Myxococcota bacterium]